MQICVLQREGVRYFSRFRNIPERDRLEIEVKLEDRGGRIIRFDLTEALLSEYEKHSELEPRRQQIAVEEQDQAPTAAQTAKEALKTRKRARVIVVKPLNELESEPAKAKAKPKTRKVAKTTAHSGESVVPKQAAKVKSGAAAKNAKLGKPAEQKSAAKKVDANTGAPSIASSGRSKKTKAETAA